MSGEFGYGIVAFLDRRRNNLSSGGDRVTRESRETRDRENGGFRQFASMRNGYC